MATENKGIYSKHKESQKKNIHVTKNAGDPEFNIRAFNHAMGSDSYVNAGMSASTSGAPTSAAPAGAIGGGAGESGAVGGGMGEAYIDFFPEEEVLNEDVEQEDNKWYHGTSEKFDHFDRVTNWFTNDENYARQFGNEVYSCTIEPKKVFDAGRTDSRVFDLMPVQPYKFSQAFRNIIKDFDEKEVRDQLAKLAEENGYEMNGYKMPLFTFVRSKYFAEKLKELGYDAISANEYGHKCLGVLDPSIINIDEGLNEDTVKQNGKWVNKGKEGTHGKFTTKKAADAQRKAMFANGYHESLETDSIDNFINDLYDLRKRSIAEDGEYGIGNLIFKEMRSLGYLDNLKQLKTHLETKEMSLESLNEKIEKHDTLNPDLFDDNDELRPEVAKKIWKVVDKFVECLYNDDVEIVVKDVVILGSNASYNYNDTSDIDVHIIADTEGLDLDKAHLAIIYNAYKSLFNNKYDVTIRGHEVEVYVEEDECNAKSNGIYSLDTGWIKHPVQQDIPDIDYDEFEKEFTKWEDRYFELINSIAK